MNKSKSLVMVAGLIALMTAVVSAQVPGDQTADFYYFADDGIEVQTSMGVITRPAGTLTVDTDGLDLVAFFIGGVDVSVDGCLLCDAGPNDMPGAMTDLSDFSSWTVGFSAGSTQWIRGAPLSGDGFRGVVGEGYVDGTGADQAWPGDVPPFINFPEAGTGVANYAAGLTDDDFSKVFDDGVAEAMWSVQYGTDTVSAGLYANVTVLTVPEPSGLSLLGLAGLSLLGFRRR